MGSIVGLWLLVHARERIGRAVLASTAAQIPGPDLWNSRIQSARESGMEGIASALAERWFTKHFRDTEPARVETVMEMVRTTPLHGYLAALAAVRDMDQREAIRSIRSKVLVIAGRHDPSTPPGMGALVASSIEGAKFVTLEASHMSNIEDETNFIKAAVEFLTAPEITAVTRPPRPRAPAKTAAAKNSRARKTAAKKAPAKKASGKKPGPRNSKQRCQRKRPPQKNQPQERSRRSGRHEKGHEKKDVRQEKKLNRERLARGAKVLMQNKPFSIILAAEGEVLLMQNNVIGGSSDRDDGGRGNLGKSRRHVGGDNINSGRGTAHPVAKQRRIKALTWLGGYFHPLRRKGKVEIGLLGGKQ